MKKIYEARPVARERDNEIIGWIRAKADGQTWGQIAAASGSSARGVEQACRKVLHADIEESGEDFGGSYWGNMREAAE